MRLNIPKRCGAASMLTGRLDARAPSSSRVCITYASPVFSSSFLCRQNRQQSPLVISICYLFLWLKQCLFPFSEYKKGVAYSLKIQILTLRHVGLLELVWAPWVFTPNKLPYGVQLIVFLPYSLEWAVGWAVGTNRLGTFSGPGLG
jgi:hypothetical protein